MLWFYKIIFSQSYVLAVDFFWRFFGSLFYTNTLGSEYRAFKNPDLTVSETELVHNFEWKCPKRPDFIRWGVELVQFLNAIQISDLLQSEFINLFFWEVIKNFIDVSCRDLTMQLVLFTNI